MGGRLIVATTK